MTFFKAFFTVAALMAFTVVGFSQDGQGELEDVEIEIVRERLITLPKASRNFEKIPPRPSEPIAPPIKYDFTPFNFQTAQINPSLKPLRLKQEDPANINGGYISAGYGNYASPYLEGLFNSKKNKGKLVGAHGLFSSSDKGPVDKQNSGSGLTMLSVYGRSFGEDVSVSGDIGFENRTTHFYGYPAGTVVEAKDIKQSFTLFKLKGDISNSRATDFSYRLGAGFNYLTDKYSARETEVDFDLVSGLKISDASSFDLKSSYYLISRKDVLVEPTPRHLFQVNPALSFVPIDDLKVRVGVTGAYENDSINAKQFHVYPDFRASYPLSPSVEAVASLTGGMEKVSLQTLSNENMWIAPNIPVFHTNKLYDFQASLHTRIGNKVAVNGGFSFAGLKNWYFFVNSPTDQSKFVLEYENKATTRSNLFASLGFAHGEKASFLLRGDIYQYGRDGREAWHKPTYKVTGEVSFNIATKLLIDINMVAQGGMIALTNPVSGATQTLDTALDLNFRTEYLVSDKLSIFVQLNNLLNTNYPIYLYYPARGFQGMGGITWNF